MMTEAQRIAYAWAKQPNLLDLPEHLRVAVNDVIHTSHVQQESLDNAEELWKTAPEHSLALEPGNHNGNSEAFRFEEIDGEIVEIRKDSASAPLQIIYRPHLRPPGKADPAAAIEARLRGEEVGR